MADLTADATLRVFRAVTKKMVLDTSAAQTIYKGQPMIVDQSEDATGPVRGFVDATVVAATDVFMGIAAEGKAVASGDPENLWQSGIEVYTEGSIIGFKSTVFTDGASNGLGVYMSDSATLVGVAGVADNPYLGILMWVEDGYAYVLLHVQICTGA
jgi:hypothetical protein